MMRMLSALLLLIAGLSTATGTASAQTPAAEAWEIGPIIRGRNRSIGMPLNPEPAGRGIAFDFPYPTAGAGRPLCDLSPWTADQQASGRHALPDRRGARREVRSSGKPGSHGDLVAVLPAGGDTWNGRGPYAHYRWWSGVQVPVTPGVHQLAVDLDDEWISVWAGSNRQTPVPSVRRWRVPTASVSCSARTEREATGCSPPAPHVSPYSAFRSFDAQRLLGCGGSARSAGRGVREAAIRRSACAIMSPLSAIVWRRTACSVSARLR